MTRKTATVLIRMPEALRSALQRHADALGLPMATAARRMIIAELAPDLTPEERIAILGEAAILDK